MMLLPNIGYLFNKDYYSDAYFKSDADKGSLAGELEKKNQTILTRKLSEYASLERRLEQLGTHKLCFKTTYPGLLIGGGYIHEVGHFGGLDTEKSKNDPGNTIFKLGFYFDYTTGLPVIPGSSVKGTLRSAFNHKDYIYELMKKLNINVNSLDEIGKLEKEIFEGEIKGEKLSIYKRDVFYDAEINFEAGNDKIFLGDDYITPHYRDLLKNPKPIKFLKVLPGVIWRFSFDLRDSCFQEESLLAEQKLRLFRQILCDLGVGAKTNLGYGYFDANYGLVLMDEDIKRIKYEKEEKVLAGKSELEMRLHFLEKETWSSELEKKLGNLCKQLDSMEKNDQRLTAEFLKEIWTKSGKWQGGLSAKQSKKVKKVKQVLDELIN